MYVPGQLTSRTEQVLTTFHNITVKFNDNNNDNNK